MKTRLTERDLNRIVKRVINEDSGNLEQLKKHFQKYVLNTKSSVTVTIKVTGNSAEITFPGGGDKSNQTFTHTVSTTELSYLFSLT